MKEYEELASSFKDRGLDFDLLRDFLDEYADLIEKLEHHATNSINRLRETSSELSEFI